MAAEAGLDRRRLLAIATGGVFWVGALGAPALAATRRQSPGDPLSMAMHLHGSFSEGIASMDAHLEQAQRLGVDIVWWTDHDFRQSAFGYRRAVRFDGESEPEDGKAWTWLPTTTGELTQAAHAFVSGPTSPDETGGALQLRATAPAGSTWGTYLLEGVAWLFTYSTSYIDTTLVLDVLPQQVGNDANVIVEVSSSHRPATGGRPAGIYRLQYRLGGQVGRWTEENGLLGVIGVGVQSAGGWQRLKMHLRADHAALWPDTVAGDASLKRFRVGVRARNTASVSAVVDRLRFRRERKTPADGAALLRSVVQEYRGRYPGIAQYAAAEVSLVSHLNAFGGDGALPTYRDKTLIKDTSLRAHMEMVRFLHRHGAVVSINHPATGPPRSVKLARKLVSTRGLGADVIEIGTDRKVETLARQYDIAARNAVFLTANGTSDDHEGVDWLGTDNPRWLTGVWSQGVSRNDACAALVSGRAWFYDPLWWSGELDLLIDGHVPMGGVLLTSGGLRDLTVTATALPRDGSLELVVGRCDRAGLSQLAPANTSTVVPAAQVVGGQWSARVRRGGGIYVRVMVRTEAGAIVGFSNPIWVLPAKLQGSLPIPRSRRYVDR